MGCRSHLRHPSIRRLLGHGVGHNATGGVFEVKNVFLGAHDFKLFVIERS